MAKNSAAAVLGRLGGAARARSLTKEQRSAIARKAALASHGKLHKPIRWHVLIGGDDPNHPQLLFASRDRSEVIAFSRKHNGPGFIDFVEDYNPTRIVIERQFESDPGAKLQALQIALEEKGE